MNKCMIFMDSCITNMPQVWTIGRGLHLIVYSMYTCMIFMDSCVTKAPQVWTVGRGLLTTVYFYVHLHDPHAWTSI